MEVDRFSDISYKGCGDLKFGHQHFSPPILDWLRIKLSRQCCSQVERRGRAEWFVWFRKDGHHREFWPCFVGNRALPARRKTVGGKWVLDFNSSHKIHCKLDIAIPCRSCNQTRSGSTYVDFWSAINLHASLSIHEMLGIGIVWFVQTLFSFFFIWVASSLDPGQRCDAGLDRDCSVCWLHKWFQGLHVCISATSSNSNNSGTHHCLIAWCWDSHGNGALSQSQRISPRRTHSGCSKSSRVWKWFLGMQYPSQQSEAMLPKSWFLVLVDFFLKADLYLSFALEKTWEQGSWCKPEEDREKVQRLWMKLTYTHNHTQPHTTTYTQTTLLCGLKKIAADTIDWLKVRSSKSW